MKKNPTSRAISMLYQKELYRHNGGQARLQYYQLKDNTAMLIYQLSQYDQAGGAAKAAERIHQSLLNEGIDSKMLVNKKRGTTSEVFGPSTSIEKGLKAIRPHIGRKISQLGQYNDCIPRHVSVLPSSWPNKINNSDCTLVNLHWVQGGMMSIEDIGKINKPTVWTLHDMWAYCGAEDYSMTDRYAEEYMRNNSYTLERGIDIDRITWLRKRRSWKKPIEIVCPSKWMADCARKSILMKDWNINHIPYPLDTEEWKPVDKHEARKMLGLPVDQEIVLFGADGGTIQPRKGFHFVNEWIQGHLCSKPEQRLLVIFGGAKKGRERMGAFDVEHIGKMNDTVGLRCLYSAADVFVLPSTIDNMPLTCMEAMACGTPVVAFGGSGTEEMINHKVNGFIVKDMDAEALGAGIEWILSNAQVNGLSKNARGFALQEFNPTEVAKRYKTIYSRVVREF